MNNATTSLGNYWDQGVPDFSPNRKSLQQDYDVIVVGGGYSGLATAAGLAAAGMSVLVLEAKTVGFGASSRNAGMVGPSFHELGILGLARKYGDEKARDIMRMGVDALDYAQELFTKEDFDCAFQLSGRFRGARNQSHFKSMIAESQRLSVSVGLQFEVLGASDVKNHTGAHSYVGGILYPRDGGVHPKKLTIALAKRAEAFGAQIEDNRSVTSLFRRGKAFEVITPIGALRARQVVLATNGYSDGRVAVMNARIVPIRVTASATRELSEERIRAMSPQFHMQGESGRIFVWSRPSPDRKRFVFGGRISNPDASAGMQQSQYIATIRRLYPELEPTDIEYIWQGKIAYTVDHSPHLEEHAGIWLVGGYCGSGVTRSLYFADKLVRKMTGQKGADTPVDDIKFPRVPFRPFAPYGASMLARYYALLDRRDVLLGKM